MARNDNVSCAAGATVQLTNANVAAVRVHNLSGYTVTLQATSGTTPPASRAGGVVLQAGGTLAADLTLAQLWPGVTGANRLWAFADLSCELSVSHADA